MRETLAVMSTAIATDSSAVRLGVARGRYFRENFAQGGVDLVQIIPELVTNADAAIAATGQETGRIILEIAAPDPWFLDDWRARMRSLRSPALQSWRHELRCTDDGEGVDAELIDRRLGALGVEPPRAGQRGLFGRGLRDVWLAQGAGRIEGVRAGRAVESWFFPAPGDEPYAFMHVRDAPATSEDLKGLGVKHCGTRVTVPLSAARLPPAGRMRMLVSQLVQLRPILEDPARSLYLVQPDQTPQLIGYPAPEPDPERAVLFDAEVAVTPAVSARIIVRRAKEPISQGFSRATRRDGLLNRSARPAHETTLASFEGRPGTRHLYGEVYCEAIEALQRDALNKPRPELVVKVDRSGLNEHHPIVEKLYAAIDQVLKPLVAAEERRANTHLINAPRAVTARDQVGLRALNDLLKTAFDQPGHAGNETGHEPATKPPPIDHPADNDEAHNPEHDAPLAGNTPEESPGAPTEPTPLAFKQSPIRLHPGESRTVTLLANPTLVPPGSQLEIESDPGVTVTLRQPQIPAPGTRGLSTVQMSIRARVTVEPGSRLTILATAAAHNAELELIIVRHRASGWVREIARKNSDQSTEAEFDPETGTVTVYEGRREFRELERAAQRAGYTRKRAPEYVPFRMLEVEAAANAVYHWAATEVLARRTTAELPSDPADFAQAIHHEAQALRHRAHHKLMQAFLDPEIFDGAVILTQKTAASRQLRLVNPNEVA
jgi:hypothetical protein